MKKTLSIIVGLVFFATMASAQKFGVRAGLNYGTISGPTASAENYKLNNGFHFGFGYQHDFTDVLSVRAEIAYFQTGYKYNFNGDSFYVLNSSDKTTYELGNLDLTLENSLGYLSIPVVASVQLTNKLHINAGLYANFLANPTGAGQLRFESSSRPDDIKFRQGLDYKYSTDGYWGESNKRTSRYITGSNPVILVDGEDFVLPRFAGAYWQYNNSKNGNLYNSVDAGLTFGFEYFLTSGFFVGATMDYGLTDITNNNVDYDRTSLNENESFKYSEDFDRLVTYRMSIGFRF